MKAECDCAVNCLGLLQTHNKSLAVCFSGSPTIQIDKEFGTRLVRKFEPKNGSKFGTPANDRNKMDIAWRALVSHLAETGSVRSCFCHIGVNQMTHHRFSRKTAVYSLFQLTVGLGLSLMLTQMLCP